MIITDYDTKKLAETAIAALPKSLDLIYVDYRDELSDKQCALIVSGKPDGVLEQIDEAFMESRWQGEASALEEALPDEDEREALKASPDYQDVQQAIWDRDNSTPFDELLGNTGEKLIRFYLRDRHGERIALDPDSWRWSPEKTEKEARKLCKAARLDWTVNRAAMIELVQNATYGGVLCIISYEEMSGINDIVEHCLRHEDARVRLTFKNPTLLVHDFLNGSGSDTGVQGEVTIKFGRGAIADHAGIMELDAKGCGHGYSWDETCGLHKPAYRTEMHTHLFHAKKNQKPDKPSSTNWPGM